MSHTQTHKLNADQTKLMMFSNEKSKPLPSLTTFQGTEVELLNQHKYLETVLDDF